MAAHKGHIKQGGRKKGVQNKNTAELRERVQLLIDDNMDLIKKDLKKLSAYQRVQAVTKLIEFVLPKGISVDLKGEISLKQFLDLTVSERIEALQKVENESDN